jgi:hypothetical protein
MDGLAELHDRGLIHGDWDARHILVDLHHAVRCRIMLAAVLCLSLLQRNAIAQAELVLNDAYGHPGGLLVQHVGFWLQFVTHNEHIPCTKTQSFCSAKLASLV